VGHYTLEKVLGTRNELSCVRVWRVGPFYKHTLELRFKRKIFMIFIVDYYCKKGFLKIEKILIRGQSFKTDV
jgi:hypothetical protein